VSRLPAAAGKETSHGDGALPLRQVRVEGLVPFQQNAANAKNSMLAGLVDTIRTGPRRNKLERHETP